MDLDGFKDVNDTKGHAVGDLVLQWAAERLHEGLRPSDLLSRPMGDGAGSEHHVELARLGGDEFTALILDLDGAAAALAVASRVGQMMRRPFLFEGSELALTTSIGISIYPEDGHDAATLLKHADTAMYHAKSSGRDTAKLYSASLTQEIQQRMEVEASLRAAIERDEFHLVYQPQLDVATRRIRSVEALLRWSHPVHGPMGPARFIPLAEESGLIERIGDWVLRQACSAAARWNREGHRVSVAVNLSPVQVRASDLPRRVADALARAGLAPEQLELEITEGALMENTQHTLATLQALRALGVRIALDDFGAGYSSLAYLTRMPIQHIKIDRSFVSSLLDSGESEAIVRAVLAMAGSLGLLVTAEGVENLAQAQRLESLRCHRLQGYHFSRPVDTERIPGLLMRRWTLATERQATADAAAR
jgi:predicted signal transduction protein with EAL and GGDEF domain